MLTPRHLASLVDDLLAAFRPCQDIDPERRRAVIRLWDQHLGDVDPRVLALAVEKHISQAEWWPTIARLKQLAREIEADLVAKGRAIAAEKNPPPAGVVAFRDADGARHELERHYKTGAVLRDHQGAFLYRVGDEVRALGREGWGAVEWIVEGAREVRVVRDLDEVRRRTGRVGFQDAARKEKSG